MYPAGDLRGLLIVEAHQPPGNIDPWPMQCLVIVAGGLPVNALAAPQDLRHISIARSLCRPLFKSGQLLDAARAERFTLYLLDVLMPGMTGMDAAREIRSFDAAADIIFLTTSPGFAYESYGVRAAEYLLKPINAKLLYPVLDKLYLREQKPQDGLTVKSNGMLVRLPFSQLSYVEVNGKHLFFNMADGTVYEVAASMREYEGALLARPEFMRVHRSYIVNMLQAEKLSPAGVITFSGHNVPVSRLLYGQLQKDYLALLFSWRDA